MGCRQSRQLVLLQMRLIGLLVFVLFILLILLVTFIININIPVKSSFPADLAAAYSSLAAPVTGNNSKGTEVEQQHPEGNSLGFHVPNPDIFLGSSGTAILILFY